MKHYTEIVPFELAKRLAAAGYGQKDYGSIYTEDGTHLGCAMPSPVRGMTYSAPTYAEVFDWLMEHSISVEFIKTLDKGKWIGGAYLFRTAENWRDIDDHEGSWKEVADWAISKALKILEEKK